jgi:hypothetical protein
LSSNAIPTAKGPTIKPIIQNQEPMEFHIAVLLTESIDDLKKKRRRE